MSHKRSLLFVFASLTLALLTSCQSNATPTLAELPGPGTAVGITDDSCPSVTVQVGQQIGWTNQGKQDHIIRAKSTQTGSAFSSGVLKPGDNFAISLTQPDSFKYDCSEDGSLTGTITVEP